MGLQFNAISESDFSKIGEKPEFMKIEEALVKIGGGGPDGVKYKMALVKQAGWKYPALTSYGKNVALATQVFNKIRDALTRTDNKDELLNLFSAK